MIDLGSLRHDPIAFADQACGIKLHPGQERFFKEAFEFGLDGRLKFRYVNVTASNRWGKTVVLAIIHLFYAVYKHGLQIEGSDWAKHPYGIINLCSLVDLAGVLRDMVHDILQNNAKEQINRPGGRGRCILGPFFERGQRGYLVPIGEYNGFKTKLTNVTLEYRTTDDNAKAIQGTPKFLVTFDEAGRQKNFTNLMGAHVVPRTLDTGGTIFTATTPDVDTGTDYEDWWRKGDPENETRDPLFYSTNGSITENPYVTQQQVEELKAGTPSYLWEQVLSGKFVQSTSAFFGKPGIDKCFIQGMLPTKRREKGHFYIIGCDLAVSKAGDRSVFVVWDATKKPFRVMDMIEPPRGTPGIDLVFKMKETLDYWNAMWVENGVMHHSEALLCYDATAMGGKVFTEMMIDLTPRPRPIEFTLKRKLQMLTSLRLLLDQQGILIPGEYHSLRQELRDYKREDHNITDTDACMAMAIAAYMAERSLPMEVLEEKWIEAVYP